MKRSPENYYALCKFLINRGANTYKASILRDHKCVDCKNYDPDTCKCSDYCAFLTRFYDLNGGREGAMELGNGRGVLIEVPGVRGTNYQQAAVLAAFHKASDEFTR